MDKKIGITIKYLSLALTFLVIASEVVGMILINSEYKRVCGDPSLVGCYGNKWRDFFIPSILSVPLFATILTSILIAKRISKFIWFIVTVLFLIGLTITALSI